MYILNHESTIMFSQVNIRYRVIFTHKEVLNLPPLNSMHLYRNPYIQQLSGNSNIQACTPLYLKCKRGVNNIEVFERRLFLATGGAINNIPLDRLKCTLSGSILIPCISYSELEDNFENVRFPTSRDIGNYNTNLYEFCGELTEKEKNFVSYLEYYYPSYHSLNNKDFIDEIKKKDDVIYNMNNKMNDDIQDVKSDTVNKYKVKYNKISDMDISVSVKSYDTFRSIANFIYKMIKENCKSIGDVYITEIETISSFKYKIYGPGLMRPIDLFKINYGPEKMTKKFYLPIVRMWYNKSYNSNAEAYRENLEKIKKFWNLLDEIHYGKRGNDKINTGCLMYSSCVSTILSGLNNSYKWFSCNKIPADTILKYMQRGFSLLLNDKEKTSIVEYLKISERWAPIFDSKDINDGIFGVFTNLHQFFTPCKFNAGIRYQLRKFSIKINNNNMSRICSIQNNLTDYNQNLDIKSNTKVFAPNTAVIKEFIKYYNLSVIDEFSDEDI